MAWIKKRNPSKPKPCKPAAEYPRALYERSVMSAAGNAWIERNGRAHFGTPEEKAAARKLAKRGLIHIEAETRSELYARLTPAGQAAYRAEFGESDIAYKRAVARGTYRHATKNPAPGKLSAAEARAEYKRTHWGNAGKGKVQTFGAPDPRAGVLVELGELTSIVYTTKKGRDRELVEYEHDFEKTKPRLCFNGTGLVIVGGTYKVNERGIVG
jgi:hypothetical protein